MDLLANIAQELGFEYHLYIVHDELFGAKKQDISDWIGENKQITTNSNNIQKTNQYTTTNQEQQQQQQSDVSEFINKYSLNFPNINSYKLNQSKNDTRNINREKKQFLDRNKYGQPDNDNDYILNDKPKRVRWNGIVGDLVTGSADLSFAPLSVTK